MRQLRRLTVFPLACLIGLIATTPQVAARHASTQQAPPRAPFALEEATIASVHAAFKAGTLTCRALVDAYLARIDAYDKAGPALTAIVVTNPKARAEADALDARFKQSGLVGPLHCVPAIVKDNYETI